MSGGSWAVLAGLAAGLALLVALPGAAPPRRRVTGRGRATRHAPAVTIVAVADRRSRRRRSAPEDALLAHARLAEELAALCSAGLDARSAWAALPPLPPGSPAWSTVRAARAMLAVGGDVATGLSRAADPAGGWMAIAWHVSTATGAPLAAVLEELAASARRHVADLRRRRAAVAGPRATARVLTAMPAMGLALGALIGVDPVTALVGSAPGRVCLLGGIVAWLAGHLWSTILLRSAGHHAGHRAGRRTGAPARPESVGLQ